MRHVWRVLYPILIYFAITVVVLMLSPWEDAVINTMLAALVTIPVLGRIFHREQLMRGKSLLAGGLSGKQLAGTVVFGMSACIALNNIISISNLALYFPGFEAVSMALYSPPLLLQIVAIGLVIPVVEELIFRGLGFARLRDICGFWPAALVSALIFGLYHGNVVQFVYAGFLGFALCWVYEQTGSFLAPVVFHQAANLVSVLFTSVLGEEYEAFGRGISLYIITLAAFALAVLAAIEMKKSARKEELS